MWCSVKFSMWRNRLNNFSPFSATCLSHTEAHLSECRIKHFRVFCYTGNIIITGYRNVFYSDCFLITPKCFYYPLQFPFSCLSKFLSIFSYIYIYGTIYFLFTDFSLSAFWYLFPLFWEILSNGRTLWCHWKILYGTLWLLYFPITEHPKVFYSTFGQMCVAVWQTGAEEKDWNPSVASLQSR